MSRIYVREVSQKVIIKGQRNNNNPNAILKLPFFVDINDEFMEILGADKLYKYFGRILASSLSDCSSI